MITAKYIVPLLLCLIYGGLALPRIDPLAYTNVGLIRGLSAPDGDYSIFLGIPYGIVDPENPFGASAPHPGFEGTYDAFEEKSVCPQIEEFNNTIVGSLDCLHLNIFVPNTASSRNRRPVMVWIHGGGFQTGSGEIYVHGPKLLVNQDVILVTVNYRLGVYGFFCLDTPDIPGNQGLKDQLMALRWIKNNIEAFGGDIEKITLFGESAGGVSVDHQLIYAEEGLFNNVIIQSGTALSPFAITESDTNAPLKLAEHLGYNAIGLEDALNFLKSVDTDLVIAATSRANLILVPCVEKEFDNVERFITAQPINMNVAKAKTVPILIGFNSNEMEPSLFANINSEDINAAYGSVFLNLLSITFNFDDAYLAKMEQNVRQFYIGDEVVNENVKAEVSNFVSDVTFIYPSYRSIEKYMESGASSIYHYMFSYDGNRNYLKKRMNFTTSGATHADEIGYLFDISYMNEIPTPEDLVIIDRITTLWTNFAKYSNPTPDVTDILPIKWPVYTKESQNLLNIDLELRLQTRAFHDRMAYWDLFYKLNKNFQKT